MARRQSKRNRQEQLIELVKERPFLTDEELAQRFGVSVQTIRLDRLELSIPEMRERVKVLAESAYGQLKAMSGRELVGQLLDMELGKRGSSLLETAEEMGFSKTKVVRGHHIFAQANSLAVALADAPVVLTASAEIQFRRPVYVGETIFCQAETTSIKGNRISVDVLIPHHLVLYVCCHWSA
jgi:acyl-coenzyme A thioesterase PaaI-like protein